MPDGTCDDVQDGAKCEKKTFFKNTSALANQIGPGRVPRSEDDLTSLRHNILHPSTPRQRTRHTLQRQLTTNQTTCPAEIAQY